jgi:hypothetical protein
MTDKAMFPDKASRVEVRLGGRKPMCGGYSAVEVGVGAIEIAIGIDTT